MAMRLNEAQAKACRDQAFPHGMIEVELQQDIAKHIGQSFISLARTALAAGLDMEQCVSLALADSAPQLVSAEQKAA